MPRDDRGARAMARIASLARRLAAATLRRLAVAAARAEVERELLLVGAARHVAIRADIIFESRLQATAGTIAAMMLRRLTTAAAMLAVLAVLAGTARAQTLRIATLAPPGSDWEKILQKLASEIDMKTQHRVTLTLYPGLDEKDIVTKMGQGKLDGAELTAFGLSLSDPTVRILELPELFDSIEEADYAADRFWPQLQAKYKLRFILAAREETGWPRSYALGRIDTPAALTKAKLWLDPQDAVIQQLYTQLGLTGIVVPPAQVDAALAKQTIDTCYAAPAAMRSLQSSKVRYRSSLPLGYRVAALTITSTAMSRMSSYDQKTVLMLVTRFSRSQRKVMRRANDDALAAMQAAGLADSNASTQLTSAFDTAAQQTWQSLVGVLYSKQELADVLQYRQQYRAAHTASP
jgi:TRAP-type C4-dicarboxylate transport system substrate-binding protein